jgi:hypothetical protein
MLLQGMERPAPALDAYIAASALKPDDKAVARGIVALTESTRRNDAVSLAARGNALLTLGQGTEAVAALKEAERLSPGVPGVKRNLATATKLAREESRKKQAEAAAKAREKLADSAAVPSATAPTEEPSRKYSNQGPAARSH